MNITRQRSSRYFYTRYQFIPSLLAVCLATTAFAISATASSQVSYVPRQSPPFRASPPSAEPDASNPARTTRSTSLELGVATQAPLAIGGLINIELPGRLQLRGEVGAMPSGYASLINSVVKSVAGYDDQVAALVDGSFQSGLVARLSAGWRPFASSGFELFGGYTHVALSGSVSPTQVAAVVGGDFAAQVTSQLLTEDVAISSQLHNFHLGVGWRWLIAEHLVIRVNVAYMQTVSSSSSVETPQLPEAGQLASGVVDQLLASVFSDYVKLPVFGLGLGYRF